MSYAFTDWEGTCLAHHGIKGQKWGVRRYQNPDGTLTELGKARVAKGNVGYLNTSSKDRKKGRDKARSKVIAEYDSAYWKAVKKGMPQNDPSKEGQKIWNKYKQKYAAATLKDLKLKDSKMARDSVLATLRKIDSNYDYIFDYSDYPFDGKSDYARRQELMHPLRTKLKRKVMGH